MISNGKATEGLVQQGFCNSGAKLQSSTVVLQFNFCAKLRFFASIAPPSQSPETLAVSCLIAHRYDFRLQTLVFFLRLILDLLDKFRVDNSALFL